MRIKNLPSIESMDGSQDALCIEQTDGSEDKSRKVSPAQIKQYVQTGDFEATGEVKDGHGNILKDMAKSADVDAEIGDLSQTGLTGDSVAEQLGVLNDETSITKVPDSFITLQSGISIVNNGLYKKGGHIFGWITFGFSAQTPNNLKLGTLNPGYRPSTDPIRMLAGLGTENWASEYNGYAIKGMDHALTINGYNSAIKAAHIHLDYVV